MRSREQDSAKAVSQVVSACNCTGDEEESYCMSTSLQAWIPTAITQLVQKCNLGVDIMNEKNALLAADQGLSIVLQNAIALWADARTDPESARRRDLLRDKTKAVTDFFGYVGKHPAQVTPLDVKAWQAELESRSLSAATIYAQISRASSFYEWAMSDPDLCQEILRNPVHLARPKAPKAYQTESTQALSDEEVKALLAVVKAKADAGTSWASGTMLCCCSFSPRVCGDPR